MNIHGYQLMGSGVLRNIFFAYFLSKCLFFLIDRNLLNFLTICYYSLLFYLFNQSLLDFYDINVAVRYTFGIGIVYIYTYFILAK